MALFSRRKVVPEGAGAPVEAPATASTVAELRPARRRTVGQLLRETREGFGSDIPRVAAALRIRAAYLEAIEEGRYDRLPGPVYAMGFVRAYAAHLGLDAEEAVRRFKIEAEGLEAQRDLSFPVPLTERSVPTLAWVLLALILAVCAFLYYLSATNRPRQERVSPVPAELAPPPAALTPPTSAPPSPAPAASAPATSAPLPAAPPAAAPPPAPTATPPSSPTLSPSASTSPPSASTSPPSALPSPTAPATGTNAISAEPLPPPTSPPAPTAGDPAAPPPAAEAPAPPAAQTAAVPELPANLPAGHEYGLSNGDTRVLIRAIGSAWIRVSDKDGKAVFTQTLLAGDTYHVPNEPGLTFKTGVAKNLAFFVDGHQVPRISGFARSNLSLDPDRLVAGTAGD